MNERFINSSSNAFVGEISGRLISWLTIFLTCCLSIFRNTISATFWNIPATNLMKQKQGRKHIFLAQLHPLTTCVEKRRLVKKKLNRDDERVTEIRITHFFQNRDFFHFDTCSVQTFLNPQVISLKAINQISCSFHWSLYITFFHTCSSTPQRPGNRLR